MCVCVCVCVFACRHHHHRKRTPPFPISGSELAAFDPCNSDSVLNIDEAVGGVGGGNETMSAARNREAFFSGAHLETNGNAVDLAAAK